VTQTKPKGPLDGVLVLDLTTMLAGPYASMLLGDLGARIIKIESPSGDATRQYARLPNDDDDRSFGGYFQSINRNKESLVLDLKSESGKAIFRQMVGSVDIVVENFRSGVMDRLDLSYECLKALNPKLVYGALRGFGDQRTGKSPYDEWPAFDVVAQAMGGLIGVTGEKNGTPYKVGAGVGDIVPSLFMSLGIVSALHRARESGEAQFVDVGMYDSILALCERIVYLKSYFDENPGTEGNSHPLLCPFGIFPAKDGFVSIGCPRDHFWEALAKIMGQAELLDEPRFATNELRATNRKAVDEIVSRWTAQHTKAELIELLSGKVPTGPVNRADDIFADPHVTARGMLVEVEQPGSNGQSAKRVKIANSPMHFLETPGGVRSRAPTMGENTNTILAEFGYSASQIKAFRESGSVL